jgi:hypothetical protein
LGHFVAFRGSFDNPGPAPAQKNIFCRSVALRWINFAVFFALGKDGILRPWRRRATGPEIRPSRGKTA